MYQTGQYVPEGILLVTAVIAVGIAVCRAVYRWKFPSWEHLYENGIGEVFAFDGRTTLVRFDERINAEIPVPFHEVIFVKKDIGSIKRNGGVLRTFFTDFDGFLIDDEEVNSPEFQTRLNFYWETFEEVFDETGQRPWNYANFLAQHCPFCEMRQMYLKPKSAYADGYRLSA